MSFDTSRFRFDPWKNYSGVVMEQGRVQLDSDWNEWLAQMVRRAQAETLDFIGRATYPATTPFAFLLKFDGAGKLTIGPGRMYVDGLLAENHGDPTTTVWDPALGEMSNTPQPPPASETGAIAYTAQPWMPGVVQPTDGGTYLAYLDVWTRAVDYLQDPYLIDPAVGIDTTGRLQTVWQVRLAKVESGADCSNAGTPWPGPSSGLLTTAPVSSAPAGPCCLTSNTGYTGAENQNYRVEIHTPGPIGTATFKWSRDNGSVETGVTAIMPVTNSVLVSASQLSVLSMGRDQVLGFASGDWIEILDDDSELAVLHGVLHGDLHRIDTIDFAGKTITLDSPADATKFPVTGGTTPYQTDPARHTRIRRWDQSGKVYQSDGTTVVVDLGAAGSSGEIPVTAPGIAVILENGVTVSFDVSTAGGSFNSGDYWTFAARTDGSLDQLSAAAPRGIHHHYTPLSVVDFATGQASDCRPPLASGGQNSCCCCSVTVGAGAQYQSINDALAALPASGGEVCILPGRYFEHVLINGLRNVVIRGCGYQTRLASPSLAPTSALSAASAAAGATTGGNSDGTFTAVISIAGSEHIELHDFAVEADTNEVGILVDGTGKLVAPPPGPDNPDDPNETVRSKISLSAYTPPRVIDVTIKDLFLTGSTLPAILARSTELLRIDDNRVLMEDVPSLWPSIYVSGIEIHLDRNYVGIQGLATMRERLPTTVTGDLTPDTNSNPGSTAKTESATGAKTQAVSKKGAKKSVAESAGTGPVDAGGPLPVEAINLAGIKIEVARHWGGIMIAGPSREVFVCENLIEGGRFNGITLGNYGVVDANGHETGAIIGITTVHEDPCSTTGTLEPPSSSTIGTQGTGLVAGGLLVDITIDRNRISNMGLCGIGPVGIFDLRRIFEIISITSLTITNNTIRNTVLRSTAALSTFGSQASQETYKASSTSAQDAAGNFTDVNVGQGSFTTAEPITSGASFPYAAICVPAVENLVIRDNAIANFGAKPGVGANGIFVLIGEMVDISRNQVLETRDWSEVSREAGPTSGAMHGGIVLALVTPPRLPDTTTEKVVLTGESAASSNNIFTTMIYEPGLPALRVEQNVVRIGLGQALLAIGFGPFAISNNHFSCGGMVGGRDFPIAQTVLILNLGAAIETENSLKMMDIYNYATQKSTGTNPYMYRGGGLARSAFAASSNGTVLFSDNICQLEARASREPSVTSIAIMSVDHLNFTGNHSWVDAVATDAFFDAVLVAGSVNVTNNRFQESPQSVVVSGLTAGVVNITSQNISTFCLVVDGTPGFTINQSNLALISMALPKLCDSLSRQ
ncbi:DUF6519 domain-containing protein [Paraburkholderia sp. CI3]|uniref:DUF6519 domain-containing protein n=1 Tax=Paraburkholderia sp. CI3 TaxID=2991060 RepID=UPI003D1A6988